MTGSFRRPPTAQAAVLGELRRVILVGELAPGTQIVQEALAERLGVSRVPVREALKILEGEGQIVYSPHNGYFVASLSRSELSEVYRLREILEAEACRQAMKRFSDSDLVSMKDAIVEMERANSDHDIVAMTAANRHFHFSLMEPSRSPRLLRLIRQLWDTTDPYRSIYYGTSSNRVVAHEEHLALLEAAEGRDAEKIIKILSTHRRNAEAALSPLLDGAAPEFDSSTKREDAP